MIQSNTAKLLRIAIILITEDDRNLAAKVENKFEQPGWLDISNFNFSDLIQKIITKLEFSSAIAVQHKNHKLYFVDDLHCAQLKLHPHAYLSGFTVADTLPDAERQALSQAKRKSAQVKIRQVQTQDKNVKLDALIESIQAIASRTLKTENGISNYWFMPPHQARVLQLNIKDTNSATSLVLVQGSFVSKAKPLIHLKQLLFIITGDSVDEVTTQVKQLNQEVMSCQRSLASSDFLQQKETSDYSLRPPCKTGVQRPNGLLPSLRWNDELFKTSDSDLKLFSLMQENIAAYQSQAKLAVVFQAKSPQQLQVEINQFLTTAESKQTPEKWHWQTPAGSCFYVNCDLGGKGLTFVYPGVGTAYKNMLSSLHEYFPALYQKLDKQLDLKAILQADCYYVQTSGKPGLSQQAISGVGASYLLTQLLMNEFKIQPEFALGYSMGEAAMWASLGVWQEPESLIDKTATSKIFNQQISGKLTAVRKEWQLNDKQQISWNSFLVRCPAEEIKALSANFPKTYLAITQGETCIIAGDEQQCQSLLKQLGKRGIASNMVTAMHTPAAKQVFKPLQDFYHLPLNPKQPNIRFISAAHNQVMLPVDSKSIAQSIAITFSEPLDFSNVISSAINSGSRIFLEVGADRQTASVIEKITKNNAEMHSLAVNSKSQPTITSLLKCIAQLISLRVPLSLAPLMPCETELKGSVSVHE